MRPTSQSSEPIDRAAHNSSMALSIPDNIPYPLKKEPMNDSMQSYLNRSYIENYYKPPQIDLSYGDVRRGADSIKVRPKTCKSKHRKSNSWLSSGDRVTMNSSKGSIWHKRSLTQDKRPLSQSLVNIKSFGIQGYKVPHWGLKPRGDKNWKFMKTKFENFITTYTKSRKFVPPPGSYNVCQSLIIKDRKMKWPKGKRVGTINLTLHFSNLNYFSIC